MGNLGGLSVRSQARQREDVFLLRLLATDGTAEGLVFWAYRI